jgi:hypothetical protein
MIEINKLLRDPQRTVIEILQQVPLEQLDEAVGLIKRHRPVAEVCRGLMTLIATAPLSEFEVLREIYRKHCGNQAD